MSYGYSIVGLLVLILDIYVIYLIATSHADPGVKFLWIILVLLLPLVGPVLYFLLGQGRRLTEQSLSHHSPHSALAPGIMRRHVQVLVGVPGRNRGPEERVIRFKAQMAHSFTEAVQEAKLPAHGRHHPRHMGCAGDLRG